MSETFHTQHGSVTVYTGEVVLLEYYKGFLNSVTRFRLRQDAERAKEMKKLEDSYKMQKNYSWRIQEVK